MSNHSQERVQEQLRSIQSMLTTGHRSVNLERHSLLLFGGGGGLLCLSTEFVITHDRFPDLTQRGFMLLVWLGFWLGSLSVVDYLLTRRKRAQRAETVSFVQEQLTRAWWMLLTVGVLGSFAMFFFGGGSMIYALWIVLLGLGMYLFGLFSRSLIEWTGLATILFGVMGLAAGLSYGTTHWLASSTFLVGMPLAGWLPTKIDDSKLFSRLVALTVWIALVLLPVFAMTRLSHVAAPSADMVSATSGEAGVGAKIVRFEPGMRVPLRVDLTSELLLISPQEELGVRVNAPVDISMQDGVPDGRYRIAGGAWHALKEGMLTLHIETFSPRIEQGQPVIRTKAQFTTFDTQGALP